MTRIEQIIRGERQRNLPQLLTDAQAAAQRLSIATRSWPAFMPRNAALEECAALVEGLRLTLAELRPHTTTPD
jgi:hypothetical protein